MIHIQTKELSELIGLCTQRLQKNILMGKSSLGVLSAQEEVHGGSVTRMQWIRTTLETPLLHDPKCKGNNPSGQPARGARTVSQKGTVYGMF